MSLPRIDVDLACRSCGYDLRGIAADGQCPECGTPAMESVLNRADAEAASLPPLDRPALAGMALVATVLSLGTGTTVLFLADLTRAAGGRIRLLAIGCAAATLVSGWTMAARFGSRHRGNRRWFIASLVAWLGSVVAEGLPPSLPAGIPMAFAALVLWSIGPLFTTLGRRSVQFRRQGPARQPIGTLAIAAGVTAVVGLGHEVITRLRMETDLLERILLLLEATVGGLVCLGLAYLAANAVIIARGLGQVAIDPSRLALWESEDPPRDR